MKKLLCLLLVLVLSQSLLGEQINSREDDLVTILHMNERTGTVTLDETLAKNNGTLSGGTSWVTGVYSYGINFDGTDGAVILANEPNFDFDYDDPFTIIYWAYMSNVATGKTPIGKQGSSSPFEGWKLHLYPRDGGEQNLELQIVANEASGAPYIIVCYSDQDLTLFENEWHHFAITYDGSGSGTGVKYYFDGVSTTVKILGGYETCTNSILNNVDCYVGFARGSYFEGIMDEVAIYRKVLSSGKIASFYLEKKGKVY
jgi:hypothetical protein